MDSSSSKNLLWHALQVRPRFEKVVARNLEAKGFEKLLPLYRHRRQWSDRVKEIELPLFPGYVFCQFDMDNRLPLLLIPGVVSIVSTGKSPTAIDAREIEDLRCVLSSGVRYQPGPFLAVGQRVSVEHGTLEGLEGIVTKVKNEYRLVISVSLLQRSVAVDIDRKWVKPMDRERSSSRQQLVGG